MLLLLFDLRFFSALSTFLAFKFDADKMVADSFLPKLVEFADDDDDVVETEAPDDAETEVRTLLDFLSDEGQSGFSRHSSGLSEEKSARIPLSVVRARNSTQLKFEKFNATSKSLITCRALTHHRRRS
jgi:hypothetical protein